MEIEMRPMDEDERNDEFIRLKYEVGRLASDYHSEKRNKERLMERMLMIEKTLHKIEERLDNRRWDFKSIMLVLATLASLVSTIIMSIKS